jgi:hypothetical protein
VHVFIQRALVDRYVLEHTRFRFSNCLRRLLAASIRN